jgi:hypothetical protein
MTQTESESAHQKNIPWRTRLALLLIFLFAAFSLYQGFLYYTPNLFLRYFQNGEPLPVDTVVRAERVFRCLSGKLPDDEAVGFITDLNGEPRRERFRQLQYAMAPSIIADKNDLRMVVGIFETVDNQAILQYNGYRLLLTCDGGVYLFERLGNE